MQKNGEDLTYIYKRIRKALEVCEPNDKKLSGAMRDRLDYNLQFIKAFIELQGDRATDFSTVQAIGFYDSDDADEYYDDGEDE